MARDGRDGLHIYHDITPSGWCVDVSLPGIVDMSRCMLDSR